MISGSFSKLKFLKSGEVCALKLENVIMRFGFFAELPLVEYLFSRCSPKSKYHKQRFYASSFLLFI